MYENQTLINYCCCGSFICVDGGAQLLLIEEVHSIFVSRFCPIK